MKLFKLIFFSVLGVIVLFVGVIILFFYNDTKDPYVKTCDFTVSDSIIPKFSAVQLPFVNKFNKEKSLPNVGSALIDIDGDGKDEIFIGGGYGQQDAIFIFNSDKFEQWTGQLPEKRNSTTFGAISYDWDQDGKTDLIVTREDGVFFYKNETNKFTEHKIDIKLNSKSNPFTITLGDINKDGLPDMFLSTYLKKDSMEGQTIFNKNDYGSSSVLLLNNGDNTLRDATSEYGLSYIHNTFQGLFVDVNNDGWLDLVVAYDTGEPRIYRNEGGKKFTLINSPMSGKFGYPMGIAAGDINNDGLIDLFFSNTGTSIPKVIAKGDLRDNQQLVTDWILFKNEGDFKFKDIAKQSNIADFEFSWGGVFQDFNLDGRQDLVVAENYISFPPHSLFPLPCRFLIQLPSGKFASVESQAGVLNKHFAITPITSDFNNDGYPDLVYINIGGESKAFINKGGNAKYLKVRLPETNEALGAKVTLKFTDSSFLTNWNKIGEGLGTDQSNTLIFAIPTGKKAESLIVKYNSKRIDTINNIIPNTVIVLKKHS
ncbi:MAG: VCBS repeat-containing protein [Chitinophagaceae bacterium]|nr:VCBS repeat-containing protein [Chitinophagaceae bacterium]